MVLPTTFLGEKRDGGAETCLVAPAPTNQLHGWHDPPGTRGGRPSCPDGDTGDRPRGCGFVVNHGVNHGGSTLVTPPHSHSTDKAAVAITA